jgi:ABC-2 type transport system permease protein
MLDLGTRTLLLKEVRRFLRVPGQTLLAPVVTSALYVFVFGLALGGRLRTVGGVPYLEFIVPGLIMLGIISNAFLNTASSMMIMKLQGTAVDLLVTPLAYHDIVFAMVSAAAVRALAVGLLTWLVSLAALLLPGGGAVTFAVAHPVYALAFPVFTAIGLATLGLLGGIWADKFEQINFIPTFIITPLIFLGGVFYDVGTLPPVLRVVSHLNPIFYLVEGMRYGLLGRAIVEPAAALAGLVLVDAALAAACILVLRSGWKLRS